MTTRINCIFADDIRAEVGNKHSYMGVYVQDLNVPDFPAMIPKLCVACHVQCDRQIDLKTVKFVLFFGENIIESHELSPQAIAQLLSNRMSRDPNLEDDLFFALNVTIMPLNVPSAGVLSVVATINGEEFDAGKLRIRTAKP